MNQTQTQPLNRPIRPDILEKIRIIRHYDKFVLYHSPATGYWAGIVQQDGDIFTMSFEERTLENQRQTYIWMLKRLRKERAKQNRTFDLVYKDGGPGIGELPGIRCRRCEKTSFNPNDIKYKYCVVCDRFHEDRC